DVSPRNYRRVLAGIRLIQLNVLRFDADPSTLRHGVARVHYQVDKDLLELSRIGHHVTTRDAVRANEDVLTDQSTQHWLDARDNAVHVQNPWLQNLLATERQQLSCQRGRAFGGASDLLDIFTAWIGRIRSVSVHRGVER